MNKISIFGCLPPPVGGVSIHIERVSIRLNKLGLLENVYNFGASEPYSPNGISKNVRNISISTRFDVIAYLYWLIIFCYKDKSKVIHFHNNENGSFAILITKFIFRKRIIITIHDQMLLIRKVKWFRAWYVTPFLSKLYKQSDIHWIAVSENIKNQLITKGINASMISIIPAYIKNHEEKQINLNADIENFISQHSPLLSIYAFSTRIENNVDLYGVDISLSLVSRLKFKYPNIGLVVCIPGEKNNKIMMKYDSYITEKCIKENVLILKKNISNPIKLWQLSDIFLRPTNTDGDSLCVREALDVKTVVLASDVVTRPKGTIIFQNRDIKDFENKAHFILDNLQLLKNNIPQSINPFDDLLNLYNKILSI